MSKFTQAVPSNVAFAANADDALFATICYLVANRSLAMISVWSPTFALQLLERLESLQQDVIEVLQSGKWGSRQASLKEVTAPHSSESAQALIANSNGEQIDFKKTLAKVKFSVELGYCRFKSVGRKN